VGRPDRLLHWVPRLFLAIGFVLLVLGAVTLVRTLQFVSGAEHATGTVVELSRSSDSEGTVTFHPVVRFTTAEGRTVEFVSSTGSSPPDHSAGDRVEVLYDPDDPQDARLTGFFDLWLLPLVFGVMGLGFSAAALFVIRSTRAPSKADADWLREHGLRVHGGSPRVVQSEDVTVDGRSPFRVEVDVHDAVRNEVRVLTSEDVWFDPAPYLEDHDPLDVYLDPERPDRYLVDLSFLPRLAD
jgi:hypothetical protein